MVACTGVIILDDITGIGFIDDVLLPGAMVLTLGAFILNGIVYISNGCNAEEQTHAYTMAVPHPTPPQPSPSPTPTPTPKKNNEGAGKSEEAPEVKYPGNDPAKNPGKDWQWKGKGEQGSGQGNYTNPKSGESLHPDLGHSTEGRGIGPHWDYKSPEGKWYRIFPDGTIQPK